MNTPLQRSASKNQRKSPEWLSVLIIPEGSTPYRYRIRVLWLKLVAIGALLFILAVIFAGVSYTSLLRKALERDDLLSENARLTVENQRVSRLAKDVDQSRQSLERIVRSLGGKLDLSEQSMRDSL